MARKSGGLVTTGFTINFTGTTANLTDNVGAALGSIVPYNACAPVNQIKVKMTKPIRCSQIGTGDFNALRAAWGAVPSSTNWNPAADLNGDGIVGTADFNLLRSNWGAIGDN